MGMFDDVTCEHPLPDGYTGTRFQTKDMERLLDHYIITRGGKLHRKHRFTERVSYTGFMRFYTLGDDDVWHEYMAEFDNGQLRSIQTHVR